jgi:hypothetical protein
MDEYSFMNDWAFSGDEDGGVSIRCSYCYAKDMDTPWILVSGRDGHYPNLDDFCDAALKHVKEH